jgi:hypothetical protein
MKATIVVAATLLGASLLACATEAGDVGEREGSAAASTSFYGNDRVGAVLAGHPEKIPASYEAYEELFKVGRSCARTDSKEIFVVEESQTRLAGVRELHEVTATPLMPRAVITGCNDGDLSNPADGRKSYTMMAALISDPSQPHADEGDTIRTWPLEVMALDETTGLYNFYVFEPVNPPADGTSRIPKDAPGRVTRIYRSVEQRPLVGQGEFNVFQRRLEAGRGPTQESQPIGGGNRCFNCHVNGGPLMNELRDPWTNWVSFKNTIAHSQMGGLTAELVAEAVPNATTGRASLANDLEPIIRAATTEFVNGSTRTNGWARNTLSGKLPGGVPKMLESVFCQTELNYASASQSIPLEVWLDPDAAGPASIVPPASFGDDNVPFLLPVRSTRDRDVELWLVENGYLSQATATAIRLWDDENDIFSKSRCDLLPEVLRDLPTEPSKIGEHIRTFLASKVGSLQPSDGQPARVAYIEQLLRPGVRREVAQRNYLAELTARFEQLPKADQAVKAKERFRKARAREKFSGRSNPLPILDR